MAKESVYSEQYADRLRFHKGNSKSHLFAQKMAAMFNTNLSESCMTGT